MNTEPWLLMVRRRKQIGMTQADLADGIVSQSLICQIERGKVAPRAETLRRLADRLQINPEEWVRAWNDWRQQDDVCARLFAAARAHRMEEIRFRLSQGADEIPALEVDFYRALLFACDGQIREAERMLIRAWQGVAQGVQERHVLKGGKSAFRRNNRDVPMLGPQTVKGPHPLDEQTAPIVPGRLLVLEAMTRERIAMACQRFVAAAIWREKVKTRLGDVDGEEPR